MDEQGITGSLDFEALRRAIERGDPDSMLDFYADDASVRVLNGGVLWFELRGKGEVAKYLRAVYGRPAVHRVENEVLGEGLVIFEDSCEYPDGASTVVTTSMEVRGTEISRQVDAVCGRQTGRTLRVQGDQRTTTDAS
jgi:hypothetical protein